MKKTAIILTFLLFAWGSSQAQDIKPTGGFMPHSYYSFTWNTAFTLGDFNKWVGSPSPAGFNFGGRYFIEKGFNAGFNIGWQRVSQEYGYETYYGPNGIAVTATNFRFTWMVPFQISAGYMFMPTKVFSPYFDLGVGGDYMEHHLIVQEYDIYENRWDFSLTPEVGALIKFGYYRSWAALIAVNYKWTSNYIEILNDKSGMLSMMGLRVGLCYVLN